MRTILITVLVLAILVITGFAAYPVYLKATEQTEIRRLEAEAARAQAVAEKAEAEAEANRTRAEAARAEGERERAEAEGDAIRAPAEAAAQAVRIQSFVLALWGVLAPIIASVAIMAMLVGAVAIGVVLAIGQHRLGLVGLLRRRVEAKYRDATE